LHSKTGPAVQGGNPDSRAFFFACVACADARQIAAEEGGYHVNAGVTGIVPTENIIAIDWPQNQQHPVDLFRGGSSPRQDMKDSKLKSKDFFNAKDSPVITFKSTKVVQTGPQTFDLEGDFTIRGVTKTEKLTVTDNGKGSTSGSIDGTMAFDRKDYGMNRNIPFIKIANRVEVNVSPEMEAG